MEIERKVTAQQDITEVNKDIKANILHKIDSLQESSNAINLSL